VLTKDMGVDPERDRWIGMPETFGDHMDRHTSQQKVRGMNVPKIMESRHRESRRIGPEGGIVCPDDLGHKRSHGVGIYWHPVGRGEHVARLGPGIAQSNLIFNLPSTLGTQNIDGPRV
jgi:hypothetical protein